MKINLVSEATYYPARVVQKPETNAGQPVDRKTQSPESSSFEKLLLGKLSPDEAASINKLFGDFKVNSAEESKPGGLNSSDKAGSVLRGKFVDITI